MLLLITASVKCSPCAGAWAAFSVSILPFELHGIPMRQIILSPIAYQQEWGWEQLARCRQKKCLVCRKLQCNDKTNSESDSLLYTSSILRSVSDKTLLPAKADGCYTLPSTDEETEQANGPGGTANAGSSAGEGLEEQKRLEAKRQAGKLFKNLGDSSHRGWGEGRIQEMFYSLEMTHLGKEEERGKEDKAEPRMILTFLL